MEYKKYGIETYARDSDFAFYWDDELCYYEVSKEQVIKEFEGNFDELVELGYSAKDIHVFVNCLKDEKNGDEAYKNLCLNIAYLKDLERKAYSISKDMGKAFDKYLWRKDEDDSCIMVLPAWFNFADLLKETEKVKDWTESSYSYIDSEQRMMIDILTGKKTYNEVILKYISDDFKLVEHLVTDAKDHIVRIFANMDRLVDKDLSDATKSNLRNIREALEAVRNMDLRFEKDKLR